MDASLKDLMNRLGRLENDAKAQGFDVTVDEGKSAHRATVTLSQDGKEKIVADVRSDRIIFYPAENEKDILAFVIDKGGYRGILKHSHSLSRLPSEARYMDNNEALTYLWNLVVGAAPSIAPGRPHEQPEVAQITVLVAK